MMAMAVLVMAGSVKARAAVLLFDITKYHVDMKVTKDNVYKITETIEVNFRKNAMNLQKYPACKTVLKERMDQKV